MVSTLKLTKIQIPNSDSDVISLDASTGNITLNKTLGGTSLTIQGENTNTTNLQQGLAKSWANAPGSAASINDSFNVSSLTDTNTGNAQFNLANNMAATEFSFTAGHQYTTLTGTGAFFANPITGSSSHYQIQHYQNGAIADPLKYSGLAIHGDLA